MIVYIRFISQLSATFLKVFLFFFLQSESTGAQVLPGWCVSNGYSKYGACTTQHSTDWEGVGGWEGAALIAPKRMNAGKPGAVKAAAKSIPSCVFITQKVRSRVREWERGSRFKP